MLTKIRDEYVERFKLISHKKNPSKGKSQPKLAYDAAESFELTDRHLQWRKL